MKKLLLMCLGLTACATANKINKLNIGMTKPEVIKQMGYPDTSKANSYKEILVYSLSEDGLRESEYWVILEQGKVIQYGRAGDFGSAQPDRLILDHNITNK